LNRKVENIDRSNKDMNDVKFKIITVKLIYRVPGMMANIYI